MTISTWPRPFFAAQTIGVSLKLYVAAEHGHTEIVKILAHLTENPNAPNTDGETPICWAARHGHTEIVKILAPLTDNPNDTDEYGQTPIYMAAFYGHTEIVKILESFKTS